MWHCDKYAGACGTVKRAQGEAHVASRPTAARTARFEILNLASQDEPRRTFCCSSSSFPLPTSGSFRGAGVSIMAACYQPRERTTQFSAAARKGQLSACKTTTATPLPASKRQFNSVGEDVEFRSHEEVVRILVLHIIMVPVS